MSIHPAVIQSERFEPVVWAVCPKCLTGRDYLGNGSTCDNITKAGFCGTPLKRLKEPVPSMEFLRLSKDQRADLKLAASGAKK